MALYDGAVRNYLVAALVAAGCSGSPSPVSPVANTAPATPRSACEEHLASLHTGPPSELAADDPLRQELIHQYSRVFIDRASRDSAQTKSCCEELVAHDGKLMEIGCCSVSDTATRHPTCVMDADRR
jgi:hypothetical protein